MKLALNIMSLSSVERFAEALNAYKAKLQRLATELPRVLAEYGAEQARVRFSTAAYDILAVSGTDDIGKIGSSGADVTVTTEPIENGYRINANGREVAFIEFGAGVWFNGEEGYYGERPAGIVGIGEYGKGYGSRPVWAFKGENGEWVKTHGTPASNALYFTARDIEDMIAETARGILNGD